MAKQTGTDKTGKRVFDYDKQDASTKRKMEQERKVREGKAPVADRVPSKVRSGIITGNTVDYDYAKQPKFVQRQMEADRKPRTGNNLAKISTVKSSSNAMKMPPTPTARKQEPPAKQKQGGAQMPKQDPRLNQGMTTRNPEPRSAARTTSTPDEQDRGEANAVQGMSDLKDSAINAATLLTTAGPLAGALVGAKRVAGNSLRNAAIRGSMEAEAGAAGRAIRNRPAPVRTQISRPGEVGTPPRPGNTVTGSGRPSADALTRKNFENIQDSRNAAARASRPTPKPNPAPKAAPRNTNPRPQEPGAAAGRSMGKPAGVDAEMPPRPGQKSVGERASGPAGPVTKRSYPPQDSTNNANLAGRSQSNKVETRIKSVTKEVAKEATPGRLRIEGGRQSGLPHPQEVPKVKSKTKTPAEAAAGRTKALDRLKNAAEKKKGGKK